MHTSAHIPRGREKGAREQDIRRRDVRGEIVRAQNVRGQTAHGKHIRLNTLDEVLAFAHTYSAEIRNDAKARRIYRTFAALTNNQFEALLAFALWKVRGHFSLP